MCRFDFDKVGMQIVYSVIFGMGLSFVNGDNSGESVFDTLQQTTAIPNGDEIVDEHRGGVSTAEVWSYVGYAVAMVCACICLERLYTSCKTVYLRRKGKTGFSKLQINNRAIGIDESETTELGLGLDSDEEASGSLGDYDDDDNDNELVIDVHRTERQRF